VLLHPPLRVLLHPLRHPLRHPPLCETL
jgi:hypothetical protein